MHHAHHGSSRLRGRGRKDRRDHMVVRISNFESNDAIPCACHEVLMWRNAVEDINSKESSGLADASNIATASCSFRGSSVAEEKPWQQIHSFHEAVPGQIPSALISSTPTRLKPAKHRDKCPNFAGPYGLVASPKAKAGRSEHTHTQRSHATAEPCNMINTLVVAISF